MPPCVFAGQLQALRAEIFRPVSPDRLPPRQVLPSLSAGCRNFAAAAEKLTAERAQNRQLLQQHGCAS